MSMMRLRCLPVRVGRAGMAGKVPGPTAGALTWTWATAGKLAGTKAKAATAKPDNKSDLVFMRFPFSKSSVIPTVEHRIGVLSPEDWGWLRGRQPLRRIPFIMAEGIGPFGIGMQLRR